MAGTTFPFTDGSVITAAGQNTSHGKSLGVGDGSDGAFSSVGNSTITAGQIYQYTTFDLNAGHTISGVASTTTGLPYIIQVQGDCIIDGTFDFTITGYTLGYDSGDSYYTTKGANGSTINNGGAGGSGGSKHIFFHSYPINGSSRAYVFSGTPGGSGATTSNTVGSAGGGGGGAANADGTVGTGGTGNADSAGAAGSTGVGGAGGLGGGALILIVGGTLTFGAASEIDVHGAAGVAGGAGSAGNCGGGGGGGGGAGGSIYIVHYGALTDSGVTTDVTAGAGGAGGAGTGTGNAGGAGGAGGVGKYTIRKYDADLVYP